MALKLFISTPCSGWTITGAYWATMDGLQRVCRAGGHSLVQGARFGRSDLIHSRNVDVHRFLKSTAEVLITFDSDQMTGPENFITLANGAMERGHVAAPVPKKTHDWEEIVRLARAGFDDPAPGAAQFNFKVLPGPQEIDGIWWKILAAGTGFKATRRDIVVRMVEANLWYMAEGEPVPELYGRDFVDRDALFVTQLSEDFSFDLRCAEATGLHPWLAWPIEVQHIGTCVFRGRLTCPTTTPAESQTTK